MTERETNILTHTQVPYSVCENFISFLFCKLSWQEKYFNQTQSMHWGWLSSAIKLNKNNSTIKLNKTSDFQTHAIILIQ